MATVTINGPYALHKAKEEHPYLIISYRNCPSVTEYFRLVSVGDAGYPALEPTAAQKKCIANLKQNDQVQVVIESTTNHLSGLKSWNTIQIQDCTMNNIYSGVRTTQDKKCAWME